MALTEPVDEIVANSNNSLLGKHESWGRVKLGEIADIQNGFAFKSAKFNKQQEGMPLIRIRDVVKDDTETFYTGEYEPEYMVQPGDLLVGMDGDFNCARWRGSPGLLNQRVCRITLTSDVLHPKLLDYALPGYLKAINEKTSSVTVKHLSSKTISQIPLPVPPPEQQEGMVAEIEKQFSRLDEAVASLKRVKANLKRYKAAVLKAAVEGKLTEEWRKQNPDVEPASKLLERILAERRTKWEEAELAKMKAKGKEPKNDKWKEKYKEPSGTEGLGRLPAGWAWASVEQIAEIQLGKMLDKKKHTKGKKKSYLRNINVRWGRVDTSDCLEMYFQDQELDRYGLEDRDVLVCEGGEPGRAAIWDARFPDMKYQKALHRVRLHEGISAELFVAYLEYLGKSGRLEKWFTGTTIKHFTRESFSSLPFPLPPQDEQVSVLASVEQSLSLVVNLEMDVEKSLSRALSLRQSVLSAAFSGTDLGAAIGGIRS